MFQRPIKDDPDKSNTESSPIVSVAKVSHYISVQTTVWVAEEEVAEVSEVAEVEEEEVEANQSGNLRGSFPSPCGR